MQLASQLDDEDLADQLLNPFDVEAIAPGGAAMLVTLTDQHGLGWFNGRLTAWTEQRRAHHMASVSATGRAAWTEGLPALCTNLRDPGHARGRSGPDVAKRLVTAMTDWLVAAIGRAVPITSPSQRESTLAQLTPATVAVLHAARIVSDPHSRDRVVTAVCDPIPRTIPMLVEIVRACAPLPTDERRDRCRHHGHALPGGTGERSGATTASPPRLVDQRVRARRML